MLYGAIGIHPSEFNTYNSDSENEIKKLLSHKKVVVNSSCEYFAVNYIIVYIERD